MNIERGLNNPIALYYLCFGQLTFFKTSTKPYQISSFQEIDTT